MIICEKENFTSIKLNRQELACILKLKGEEIHYILKATGKKLI